MPKEQLGVLPVAEMRVVEVRVTHGRPPVSPIGAADASFDAGVTAGERGAGVTGRRGARRRRMMRE